MPDPDDLDQRLHVINRAYNAVLIDPVTPKTRKFVQ
jgi:hypothetical protein